MTVCIHTVHGNSIGFHGRVSIRRFHVPITRRLIVIKEKFA